MTESNMKIEKIKEKMDKDRFIHLVGIEILEMTPGYAKTRLVIQDKHLNAVDVVQGGAIFTLADYTMALASNTETETALAIETSLSYLRPVRPGSVLYAQSKELSRSKRLISYSIMVQDEKGRDVAFFTGRCFIRE